MKRSPSPAAVIALISLPIFIGALDLTVVSAVLPHVIYDLEIPLQSGLDDAAWVVSGYLLAYSVAMTFMGRFSDLLGRRKVYLVSLVIFAVGSYLVAVADGWPTQVVLRMYYLVASDRVDPARISLFVLILSRMVQAFGGGAMVPVGMALAGDLYSFSQVAKPLGVIAAVDTAGWVVGHLYGGIITRYLDWRTIFWINLPVCLLAFILIYLALARLPEERQAARMDWLGALLISGALVIFNFGLGSNPDPTVSFQTTDLQQVTASHTLPYLAAAVVLLGLFIWRQSAAAFPLLPLYLIRVRNILTASLANLMIGACLFIAIANVPLFINTLVAETLEQGAWDSGWMLSALTVPMALASIPGGWVTARAGYRWPALSGTAAAVIGFFLMSRWVASTPYTCMIPHLMLTGIGLGLTMAPISAAVVNAAPSADRGTASALVILFRLVGMTAGVSWMASYGTQRANTLSSLWLTQNADLAETVRIGMLVAERVINETFIIAAGICLLAILPLFFLKSNKLERRSS
jgi:MFS family permease